MTDLEIVLCRHGETDWTVSGQHTSRTDLPLNPRGVEQAACLEKRLKRESFRSIFCSPMKRCLMTCHALGPASPETEPRAVEWNYGDYEGLTSPEIEKKRPGWNLFSDGAPHGETPEQVGARADALLAELRKKQGKVLLVSHGHFLRVLVVRWIGLPVSAGALFSLSVASLGKLGFEKGRPALKLWNDVSHLEKL